MVLSSVQLASVVSFLLCLLQIFSVLLCADQYVHNLALITSMLLFFCSFCFTFVYIVLPFFLVTFCNCSTCYSWLFLENLFFFLLISLSNRFVLLSRVTSLPFAIAFCSLASSPGAARGRRAADEQRRVAGGGLRPAVLGQTILSCCRPCTAASWRLTGPNEIMLVGKAV